MSEVNDDSGFRIGAEPEPAVDTVLEQFAKRREHASVTREGFIPVQGYDREPPIMLAQYRLLSSKELELIGQDIARNTPRDRSLRQQLINVRIFTQACTGFFYELGDGVRHQMTHQGVPITGYTRQLAEALQFADKLQDPDDHAQVCFGLFVSNDVAIEKHAFLLTQWMSDTGRDITKELLEGNL